MKNTLSAVMLFLALFSGNIDILSADTIAKTTEARAAEHAWLGITLAPVPQVLSRQLGKLIPPGQGVVVEAVSPDSPAARGGIKRWDILLAMGNQKLYSPQQLAELVAASKPGKAVHFTLIRNGEQKTADITLGSAPTLSQPYSGWGFEHPQRRFDTGHYRPWRLLPPEMMPPEFAVPEPAHVMEQFEVITIRKLDNDRYHVAIEFLDKNGEKKQFVVEGSYDDVRKQIANNEELPESRKNSLLNALKKNPDELLPDGFTGFPVLPPVPAMPHFDEFFGYPDSWF